MIVVKTSIKPSNISGIGAFADEKILKGTTVWKYDPHFDVSFSSKEVEKMDSLQRELIGKYAYHSPESKKYIYPIDNARFINHSSINNNLDVVPFPREVETRAVANRDIEVGEKLLLNYRMIDADDAKSTEEYLKN